MGVNFRKRISMGNGTSLNVGKKSVGISGGVKGARIGINSSGRAHFSLSIPGTGIRFTKYSRKSSGVIATCVSAFGWMLMQIFKLTMIFTYWILCLIWMMFKWIFIGAYRLFKYCCSGIKSRLRKNSSGMGE